MKFSGQTPWTLYLSIPGLYDLRCLPCSLSLRSGGDCPHSLSLERGLNEVRHIKDSVWQNNSPPYLCRSVLQNPTCYVLSCQPLMLLGDCESLRSGILWKEVGSLEEFFRRWWWDFSLFLPLLLDAMGWQLPLSLIPQYYCCFSRSKGNGLTDPPKLWARINYPSL